MLANQSLVLDLVQWVAEKPRLYAEVMDAWRTSCPRLTIWEDARDAGLLAREHAKDGSSVVVATDEGLALLRQEGRLPAQRASAA